VHITLVSTHLAESVPCVHFAELLLQNPGVPQPRLCRLAGQLFHLHQHAALYGLPLPCLFCQLAPFAVAVHLRGLLLQGDAAGGPARKNNGRTRWMMVVPARGAFEACCHNFEVKGIDPLKTGDTGAVLGHVFPCDDGRCL